MPRPGQPGAMQFDGKNITEFLEEWNIECEDFGIDKVKRCARFPNYCVRAIKDTIKLLPGYIAEDWAVLQTDVKKLYWPHDKPKNTMTALAELVKEAHTLDLNVYVLKYTSISEALVTAHALSTLDRVTRLLDGLSDDLRRKVIRHCTKKGWKLSTQDTGTKDPKYDEITTFILTEAQTNQMMAVYNDERSIRERSSTTTAKDTTLSNTTLSNSHPEILRTPAITTTQKPATIAAVDPMIALTEQISRLTLAMQGNMQSKPPVASINTMSTPSVAQRPSGEKPKRCIWCDSTEHFRRLDCPELQEAIRISRIRINDQGRIVVTATGEELPIMFGKGGMKRLITLTTAAAAISPIAAGGNNITLESYGNLGPQSSVMITTLDFENGTRTDEIIDVEVNEKRRRDDILRRRVRPRLDDSHPYVPPPPEPPVNTPPDATMQDVQDDQRSATPGASGAPSKKYRLASEVGQHVNASHIGEKIMDTPVQLSIREVLAVSSDVSSYLHDQTRKRRIPIDTPSTVPTAVNASVTTAATINVDVNIGYLKQLYACPSGRAKVTIDHAVDVNSLLDNGSELNMMPRRIFEKTNLPIDTDISWRIEKYDSKTNAELDEHGPIGVCHKVSVDIGGVEVIQPVFVVEHCNNELILGRPWERMVRAEYINEDDGSCTARIKNLDGSKMVQFCAVKAVHERNREFARHPGGSAGSHSLKG